MISGYSSFTFQPGLLLTISIAHGVMLQYYSTSLSFVRSDIILLHDSDVYPCPARALFLIPSQLPLASPGLNDSIHHLVPVLTPHYLPLSFSCAATYCASPYLLVCYRTLKKSLLTCQYKYIYIEIILLRY